MVIDRLKIALDEGRLSLPEYDERVQEVYAARTYADLNGLLADLPDTGAAVLPAARRAVERRQRLPTALMVLWTIWGSLVAVNLVLWAILQVTVGGIYFWPIWVAGPAGAALLVTTMGVQAIRNAHHRDDD